LPFLGIDAAGLEHVRVHHAAAQDFESVIAFADFQLGGHDRMRPTQMV
jgi:hypothetical protein